MPSALQEAGSPRRGGGILNKLLAIVGILIVLAFAVLMSGLLDLDPNRDYGVLSTIGRALHDLIDGAIRVAF